MANYGKNSKIAPSATIKEGVIIGDNNLIEEDVYLDYGVIIRDNVHIKKGTFIGARCILGEYQADFFKDRTPTPHSLVIGKNSIIRSECILYAGAIIGDHFITGHHVIIREETKIGNHVHIGTRSETQGHCVIEDYVGMQSNVIIGEHCHIKKYAWLFPFVILTNDPHPPSVPMVGSTIEEFAVIASGSIILPGMNIGSESLVGAGAVVTHNVPERKVVLGSPAKVVCDVTEINHKITGKPVYPWKYTFDRGMPWKDIGYEEWILQRKKTSSDD